MWTTHGAERRGSAHLGVLIGEHAAHDACPLLAAA
jgi:hypothetical protein